MYCWHLKDILTTLKYIFKYIKVYIFLPGFIYIYIHTYTYIHRYVSMLIRAYILKYTKKYVWKQSQKYIEVYLKYIKVYIFNGGFLSLPWPSPSDHCSSSSKWESPPMPGPGAKAWAKRPSLPSKGYPSPCSVGGASNVIQTNITSNSYRRAAVSQPASGERS